MRIEDNRQTNVKWRNKKIICFVNNSFKNNLIPKLENVLNKTVKNGVNNFLARKVVNATYFHYA